MKPYFQTGSRFGPAFIGQSFGETGLKMFLIVASRTARGKATTIRQLVSETGVSINSVIGTLTRLKELGLIDWERELSRTIRSVGQWSLEFVEEPQCLKPFLDELRPQCRPITTGSPTKRANAAA